MITLTDKGLYCEAGGFHIDPMRPVDCALTTHAHSDHARRGSRKYVCVSPGVGLLRHRIGKAAEIQGVAYGEKLRFGDVDVSFHPAGHILGSAQIRIQRGHEVWVATGDYKRDEDPTCPAFEPLECDVLITEATFGHPSYEWGPSAEVVREIHDWWLENAREGRNSLLYCYALGKTQRVLAGLAELTDRPVHLFGEANPLTQCYRDEGVAMVPTIDLDSLRRHEKLSGALVIAPHSISKTSWPDRLDDPATAFASGWMRTGAFGMRNRYDRGFVLSDHADWPGLIRTIRESRARRVLILHGDDGALARHLRKEGFDAAPMTRANPLPRPQPVQGELFSLS